jgi:pyruvate kinase
MTPERLEKELSKIYDRLVREDAHAIDIAAGVHERYQLSAKNLFRYLILRSYDLRKVHDSLSDLGLSSLRSAEGYVFSNLNNVLRLLALLQGKPWTDNPQVTSIGYRRSKKLLRKHTNALFSATQKRPPTNIMVTLPEEASEEVDLLRCLVAEGMEIARINLSHGDLDQWQRMIDNINTVRQEFDSPIKIYMDLAGPKIRTADIQVLSKKGKVKNAVKLKVGDHLVLTKRETTGQPAQYGDKNELIRPAEVGVLLPQIIDDISVDDTVYFDDGMIKAIVISKNSLDAELVITQAYKGKLKAHKGINLPNTTLDLPSLTDRDIELLPFVSQHADLVGYSFVRTPEDVQKLYAELTKHQADDLGVIFKIENQEAFENLPLLLFEAMKRPKIGVMIARGDLAVELGFERISEVQSEIMWLCEAAHVPVIWATQVLENLAKTGVATRAEISDAALSAQAECVMLNKGPHIISAVRTLKEIITKMAAHSSKKKSTLRPLSVATNALKQIKGPSLPNKE